MAIKDKRKFRRLRIKLGVRRSIVGTLERPRLTIFRSNKGIYAQLINDSNGVTLAAASSTSKGIAEAKITKIEQAKLVVAFLQKKQKKLELNQLFLTETVICIMVGLNLWLTVPEKEVLNFKGYGKFKRK